VQCLRKIVALVFVASSILYERDPLRNVTASITSCAKAALTNKNCFDSLCPEMVTLLFHRPYMTAFVFTQTICSYHSQRITLTTEPLIYLPVFSVSMHTARGYTCIIAALHQADTN
jgi:hypothetical protein